MARPEEVKGVAAFRKAKTGKEMIRSWACQTPGRKTDELEEALSRMCEKRPDLIEHYAQKPLADLMDRGILNRKTREMLMIATLMAMGDAIGVVAHVQNAVAAGVTEEELWEVVAVVMYEYGKRSCAAGVMLQQGMEAVEKNGVKLYKP